MKNKDKFNSENVRNVRPAGPNHQVVETPGKKGRYRKEPCPGCPWRLDNIGEFPAEAFRISANTSYDMAKKVFACHESGTKKSQTCAGFLLRGAEDNLAVRVSYSLGYLKKDVTDGGHELHNSYFAMAVANGVAPDDPILEPCRGK